MPEYPKTAFTPISLKLIANADTHGKGAAGVPGFTNEGGNDFHEFPTGKQVMEDVEFDFVDPASNGRKACLILSGDKGYTRNAVLKVDKKASSIYVVHAQSYGGYMGDIILNYTDCSSSFNEAVFAPSNVIWQTSCFYPDWFAPAVDLLSGTDSGILNQGNIFVNVSANIFEGSAPLKRRERYRTTSINVLPLPALASKQRLLLNTFTLLLL